MGANPRCKMCGAPKNNHSPELWEHHKKLRLAQMKAQRDLEKWKRDRAKIEPTPMDSIPFKKETK